MVMTSSKAHSPLLSQKNILKQAVQGCKLINLRYNLAEIASVAGISERTAQNRRGEIEGHWSEESTTPNEDKKLILERSIEIGIGKASNSDEPTPEHAFGVILGCYLKVETDLLDKAESLQKVWTVGWYITKIHSMVSRYKTKDENKKGAPIHSENSKYAKYILNPKNMNKSNLDKLFSRSDDYAIGKSSKRWLSTELLEKYVEACNNILLNMISRSGIAEHPYSTPSRPLSHMSLQKGATRALGQLSSKSINSIYSTNTDTKKCFFKVDVNYIYNILVAPISIVEQFAPNSKFSILTQAIKLTEKNELHIPVKHKAKGSE